MIQIEYVYSFKKNCFDYLPNIKDGPLIHFKKKVKYYLYCTIPVIFNLMLELEMGLVAVGLDTGEGTQRTLVRFIPGMPFLMPSKKDIIQPHSTTTIIKIRKLQIQKEIISTSTLDIKVTQFIPGTLNRGKKTHHNNK